MISIGRPQLLLITAIPADPRRRSVRAPGEHAPTDFDLWRLAQIGDADAFGVLFERHADAIYNFCFRRTGDWSLAEDLTSIVFLEAWRRRAKELPPDMVRAWLFGIATLVVKSRSRSTRRFQRALARLPREYASVDFTDESVERIDDERNMSAVLAAFGRLPKRERDVLALCAWAEFSYEEASFALGVPIGTIRSRLSRGRQRMRELTAAIGHVQGKGKAEERELT